MKKQEVYTRFFNDENKARSVCTMKNRSCRNAGNYRDIFCLVDGPEDDFAVVDLPTAIELGSGYEVCDF